MGPAAKTPIMLAALDGRALRMSLGAKTTGRKALEAYNKGSPTAATALTHKNGSPVFLEEPLAPQCAAGEVLLVVVAEAEAVEEVDEEFALAEVAPAAADPQLAELLRVAGPETICRRCTPRALARATFLESADDDFRRVREHLRRRGFLCNEELCEQRLSLTMPRSCRLLTIGAGFGATCMIADAIMEDPTKQVVVDPGSQFFPEYHLAARLGRFKTAQGFLGKSRQSTEMVLGDVVETYYSLEDLERLVGGPFDAVLADCEGAFLDILDDFPDVLQKARWLCVEWDLPQNRSWVASVRPRILKSGLRPLDCGDRACACDEPRFRPSYTAQGAPRFHEVFVRH